MRTVALLMAGGRGERMRASGIDVPKPLVPVLGIPLIERNLSQLLRHDVNDVVVTVSTSEPDVIGFATGRLTDMAEAAGARLRVQTETQPLGNIGGAGLLRDVADQVLVVYADNLTTLDLTSLLQRHMHLAPALTLASHTEPFRLPYGRLEIVDDRVVSYTEKPSMGIDVCSAAVVLGQPALKALPHDSPTGLAELTTELIARGEFVAAFRHEAAWVDVNDSSALISAERLVTSHPELFGARTDTDVQAGMGRSG